jgi:hypothetical protein
VGCGWVGGAIGGRGRTVATFAPRSPCAKNADAIVSVRAKREATVTFFEQADLPTSPLANLYADIYTLLRPFFLSINLVFRKELGNLLPINWKGTCAFRFTFFSFLFFFFSYSYEGLN